MHIVGGGVYSSGVTAQTAVEVLYASSRHSGDDSGESKNSSIAGSEPSLLPFLQLTCI